MFIPENEMGVIVLFSQQIIGTDFEIIRIGAAFPDAIVRKRGIEYRVEFEFAAANFKAHRHDPMLCDLIICWQDNYPDSVLPVIQLQSDEWKSVSIIKLPTQAEREIAHWKSRALSAEMDRDRLLLSYSADDAGAFNKYECHICGRNEFGSVQAVNAHQRFCKGNIAAAQGESQ